MCTGDTLANEVRAAARLLLRSGRRAVRTVVGFALLLLGVAGLVLPVLPGWVLIIAGFGVLGREYTWARRALEWARRQAARSRAGLRTLLRRRDGAAPEGPLDVVLVPEVVLASGDAVIDLADAAMFDALAAEVPVEQSGRID